MNKNELIKKLQLYFEQRIDINFSLLFGSYSRNEQTVQSDIDIGIHYKTENFLTLGQDIYNLETMFQKKIDIVVLNNLPKEKPVFAYTLIKDNVLIFANKRDLYNEYVKTCYLIYFDFLPILELSKKALAERIKNGKYGEPVYAR